jgi:hypothetical protein
MSLERLLASALVGIELSLAHQAYNRVRLRDT